MKLSEEKAIALRTGLKWMVIRECNVEGASATQIGDDEPVIGGQDRLRLDSLDAVEIVAAIERDFGFKLETVGAARKIFKSFAVMSDYIQQNVPEPAIEAFIVKKQAQYF